MTKTSKNKSWYSEKCTKFQLSIDCSNDAFADGYQMEIAGILRRVANRIELGEGFETFQTILDSNGNDVGRFAIKPASYR
jgi:hypothetical protein